MLAGRVYPDRWMAAAVALLVGTAGGCGGGGGGGGALRGDAATTPDHPSDAVVPFGDAPGDAPADAPAEPGPPPADAAPDAGGPAYPAGCADGTREGFARQETYPAIAACAGAWSVPGMVSEDSREPQCDREGGDDGPRPTGVGCSVADLCAPGWHVCETAAEVAAKAGTCDGANDPSNFFATRQRSGADLACAPPTSTGTNNVHGCGGVGDPEEGAGCSPLTTVLRAASCDANPPWSCTEPAVTDQVYELQVVVKIASAGGGVLCCVDGP